MSSDDPDQTLLINWLVRAFIIHYGYRHFLMKATYFNLFFLFFPSKLGMYGIIYLLSANFASESMLMLGMLGKNFNRWYFDFFFFFFPENRVWQFLRSQYERYLIFRGKNTNTKQTNKKNKTKKNKQTKTTTKNTKTTMSSVVFCWLCPGSALGLKLK